MSSQTDLDEFEQSSRASHKGPGGADARRKITVADTDQSGHDVAVKVDSKPDPNRCCRGCGSHVSGQYARVMGDEEGVVHSCPNCGSIGENCAGAPAGLEPLPPGEGIFR